MRSIESMKELKKMAGQEVGVSEWLEVSQQVIDQFAEVTGDPQWIHTDPERAKSESPFGGTIAHGFLTLSLLPQLRAQAFEIRVPSRMSINYGLNRLRFPAPVPAGSRIRARFSLQSIEEFDWGSQFVWKVLVEREGSEKPALVAEWIGRSYS